MKRKYADYPNWDRVLEKKYKNIYFDNEDFKGNISLLTAVKVKEKLVVVDNLVLIDDGFKWLEIYPDNNKNIAISVCINTEGYFLEWYFDIAKDSALTENGVPYIDDLYLDVILTPEGEIKMIDQEELQDALDNQIISQDDYDLAYKVANELIAKIDGKINEIDKFTRKYFNILNNEI